MDDNWTIILIIVAVLFAGGLGWIFGADYGYRRGWLMGERSAAQRSLRQIALAEDRVARAYARERKTIEAVSQKAE